MPQRSLNSGGRPPAEYLFIDGAYLRAVLNQKSQEYFGGDQITLDFNTFSYGFEKKFYYDCLPPRKASESRENYENRIAPRVEFYNELRSFNGFHVFLGTTSSEGGKARQKGVDIMIAVHMLTHSFRRNMEKTTLLTGDLDFKPLIEALVQDGMYVTLWFDNASASKELIYSADSQRELSVLTLLSSATKDFLQRHPQPRMYSQPGRECDNLTFLKSGKTSCGVTVELYKEGSGEFLLLHPDSGNVGYNMHIRHISLEFIEKLMTERKMPIAWKSA